MIKFLKVFMIVWLFFAVLVNLISISMEWSKAASLWEWLSRVQEIYSPFNIINWVFEVVLLSPAIVAHWLRERLLRRQREV